MQHSFRSMWGVLSLCSCFALSSSPGVGWMARFNGLFSGIQRTDKCGEESPLSFGKEHIFYVHGLVSCTITLCTQGPTSWRNSLVRGVSVLFFAIAKAHIGGCWMVTNPGKLPGTLGLMVSLCLRL